MDWISKTFVYTPCYVCILIFAGRKCHIALTGMESPDKYVRRLKKKFTELGIETTTSEVVDNGYGNYYDKMHIRYRWRYLMCLAGFENIAQDGETITAGQIEFETWDTVKADAILKLLHLKSVPALEITYAACRQYKKKFIPHQVIRRAILKSSYKDRAYTDLSALIIGQTFIDLTFATRHIAFRKGKVTVV